MPLGEALGALVFAAWRVISRSSSRLAVWKRLLLAAVAFGAFSSESAWGQISETLPEVTVSAPRPAPRPPRRAEPAPRRAASSAPATREPAPAAPEPAPAVTAPVRRSDAHHRSRHRPQQGTGDGADAPRRGLLAHLFA